MDFRGISVLVLTAESIEKGGLALTQYLTIAKLALYHWAMPLLSTCPFMGTWTYKGNTYTRVSYRKGCKNTNV